MDRVPSEMIANRGRTSETSQSTSTAAAGERYRRPRIVAIGTATEVVQQNSTGKDSDGSGGWYVWGS
jgi:hypothetical protein